MKHISALMNYAAISAMAILVVACGDDDGNAPPPMVDCNVTGPSITLTPTTTTGCGIDDGMVAVAITNGTGALTVTIDPQPLGVSFDAATSMFTDVEQGTYTVEVIDADNCSTTESVTVGFPAGNLSYANDIDPIIQAKCSITGCHDGTQPNFADFPTFQALANNSPGGVRQRIKSGDMPRTGSLTADELAMIQCWIDEGAQDN